MAKHTFYTQSKSSFIYSKAIMYCLIFGYFIFATVAVLFYKYSTFIYIPFFILILYHFYLYTPTLKYWDMGGFRKMVIDTDAKVVIFDDKVKLKLANVERVRLELDERPTMFWFLALGKQYKELVNGELMFRLDTNANTVIHVQYKKDVKKIVSIIRKLGLPCRIQNEDLLDEGIPNYIWYLIILVFGLGGFVLLLVLFFRNVFA